MSIQTAPQPGEDRTPIAWRCEMDRKLHPMSQPSYVVYIEEIASALTLTGANTIKRHAYFIRRMIVCRACRRGIGDLEGEPMTNQPATPGTRTPEARNRSYP